MANQKHFYKMTYGPEVYTLSRLQSAVRHLLSVVDMLIFFVTFGIYNGRMADNYLWRYFRINADRVKRNRIKDNK